MSGDIPTIDWARLAPVKGSPVPRYAQLAEGIATLVRSGALPSGAQLPPERDLAEAVGISRMTARQAIAELARAEVLEIRHGVGTFVAAPKRTYDAIHLLGFTEETMRRGEAAATRVIEQSVGPAPVSVAARLLLAGDETVIRVVRLRSAQGDPLLLETSWLPEAACPGLERADLARRSLYDLLEQDFGHRLAEARQTVEAATADEAVADLLGITAGSPVLLVDGVALTEAGRPIEAFTAIYRGDRVRLGLASRREAIGAGPTARQVSLVMR